MRYALRTALVAVLLFQAAVLWAQEVSAPGRESLAAIAGTVKKAVAHMSAAQVRALMIARYQTLRLMDADAQWAVPELGAISHKLLPPRLDGRRLGGFIDAMADATAANPYVMKFLEKARGHEFPRLEAKVRSEGAAVLPAVVAHAAMLEQLTQAMVDDYRISEVCRAHWKKVADSDRKFWKVQGIFARIKTRSVNLGIDSFIAQHKAGQANPKNLGFTLPLNIMEAVGAELLLAVIGPREARMGHLANARAGMALVRNGPQGAGPSTFSKEGDLIEIQPRAVKAWDDLYATWNMSFVTFLGKWPYFMAKLVIPSVNDYAGAPGTYINRRALALEIQMYANGLDLRDGGSELDWTDPELAAVWGAANRESSFDYRARAAAATP